MARLRKKCRRQEPQVKPITGIPCAMVFTLIRSLPGAPGCLATMIRAMRQHRHERDTSFGVSGRCDFTSAIMPVVCAEKRVRHGSRPPHPAPTFVTTRTSLCMGQDDADHTLFSKKRNRKLRRNRKI
ncbi:hypothetical protein [Bradyrhizobium oligotrophicum]|uniref:hypothetical protein n=1 Tax=Bradyrhizobium oligotrophicum TaxID=44255 RepID=UPI001360B59F|nr:hypothetical protein [Bradyrhizobium oligotrophicum]